MRMPYQFLFACIGAFAAMSATADARDDRLRGCAAVESDARRLECYDDALRSEAAAPGGQRKSAAEEAAAVPASTPGPRAPAAASQAAAEARFGLDKRPEPEAPERDLDELRATIAEIERRRNGERIFTLDNGQVWAEKSPSPSLRLKNGDPVTIKAGMFGSHRLFGSGKRSSRVYRVR